MVNFVSILIPLLLLMLLLKLLVLPIRWFWKLSINSACGFLCLWLLNSAAAFTGVYFPVNAVTVVIAGFLGLPGIGALALVQLFL
jgi:inhibitor of the pro-sigma K processing machinery